MKRRRFLHFRCSFTLIEILVVVGVTLILSATLIVWNSKSRGQLSLSIERAKISQLIFKSKSLAIASYTAVNPPLCGFGVFFDYTQTPASYSLFSYKKPLPSSDCSSIGQLEADFVDIKEEFKLSSDLLFADGSVKIDAVFFVPPDPLTMVFSGNGTTTEGYVYLTTRDGSNATNIKVTSAGQISL